MGWFHKPTGSPNRPGWCIPTLATTRFRWLRRERGTVCHHTSGSPHHCCHFGGRRVLFRLLYNFFSCCWLLPTTDWSERQGEPRCTFFFFMFFFRCAKCPCNFLWNVTVIFTSVIILIITSCAGGRHNMSRLLWPWLLTFWPWKWCLSHVWRGLPLCQSQTS